MIKINARINTKVVIKLDSGPNFPPLIRFWPTWLHFKIDGVEVPLTLNPNIIPCEKFHAVWVAPQIQILSYFQNIRANNIPTKKILINDNTSIPGFNKWFAEKIILVTIKANRMLCLLDK